MSRARPRFSIQVGQQFAAWPDIVRIWQEAERLAYDAAFAYDHFMAVMMDPFDPCLEAWTALAALAAHTSRLRLGVLVTGNTYRHPAVLAKMATTVDVISGGRLDFGIGSGWFEAEHAALGIPFRSAGERCAMLDEALTAIRALWTQRTASFAGRYYALRDAIAEPKPVQRPHPPILVAASGEKRMLRIVARHADAWNSFGSPEVFRHKIAVLAEHCRAEGRDLDAIEKSVLLPAAIGDDPDAWAPLVAGYAAYLGVSPDEAAGWMLLGRADEVKRQIERYLDVGVTHFILTLTPFNFPVMERFAADVMPAFR
ncbi:MAG TPA: LLM class F420-dependent oxidoreductase [Candidatus Binatia bacterium]|nr:LLM class F420-dependent oxidoreductase [Candidatus Binatia bacterium]